VKRGKPLRRRTWMRARSKTNSYRRRDRDLDYMRFVRKLPCVAHELGGCSGHVEADHAGRRGTGQKCSDLEVISLCKQHHQQRADFSGPFRSWNQEQMRVWLAEQIAKTQAFARQQGALK